MNRARRCRWIRVFRDGRHAVVKLGDHCRFEWGGIDQRGRPRTTYGHVIRILTNGKIRLKHHAGSIRNVTSDKYVRHIHVGQHMERTIYG